MTALSGIWDNTKQNKTVFERYYCMAAELLNRSFIPVFLIIGFSMKLWGSRGSSWHRQAWATAGAERAVPKSRHQPTGRPRDFGKDKVGKGFMAARGHRGRLSPLHRWEAAVPSERESVGGVMSAKARGGAAAPRYARQRLPRCCQCPWETDIESKIGLF